MNQVRRRRVPAHGARGSPRRAHRRDHPAAARARPRRQHPADRRPRPGSPRAPSSASSRTRTRWSWPPSLQALDPQPTLDALAAIDRGLDLRQRLTAAADLIQQRFADNAQLMSAARIAGDVQRPPARGDRLRMARSRERLQAALTEVIEPDAGGAAPLPRRHRPAAAAVRGRQHLRPVRRPGELQRRRPGLTAARRPAGHSRRATTIHWSSRSSGKDTRSRTGTSSADPTPPRPPASVPERDRRWSCCSSSCRPWPRSTCPRSTPTSSTTAS